MVVVASHESPFTRTFQMPTAPVRDGFPRSRRVACAGGGIPGARPLARTQLPHADQDTGALRTGRRAGRSHRDVDARAQLGEIHVPTRIIVGGHDILTPVSVSEKMAARIPGAELCVIPECGHITFTERPAETVALIEEFLRKVMR